MQNNQNDKFESAKDILKTLVGFDTTSRNSNLELIEWVECYLGKFGARFVRVPSDDFQKTNLIASFGPNIDGGIVFSGHSDVVPVDDQDWSSEPFDLIEKDGKFFGRGTCDMKGFSACFLALAPYFSKLELKKPIHYALSYDEEVGCVGAPRMVEYIAEHFPKIAAVIVGEPTDMKVVSGHKGICSFIIDIIGKEAHSSRPDKGVSAIMEAIPLMQMIKELGEKYRPKNSLFEPSGATLTIGIIKGGTAVNILAHHCRLVFDLRYEPDFDPNVIINQIKDAVSKLDASIKARVETGGAIITQRSNTPGLKIDSQSYAEVLSRRTNGDNENIAVAYAAEAGIFAKHNMPTVICGPGSILQAHQPDEYVEVSQINECIKYLEDIINIHCL